VSSSLPRSPVPRSPVPFAGAVLCGGASRRMGRDKALIPVEGRPLAVRVAEAIAAAGATRVLAIGGDIAALRRVGLDAIPDADPGAGPLNGIITALDRLAGADAGDSVVFVGACDLVRPDPGAIAATVAALAGADDGTPARDDVDASDDSDADDTRDVERSDAAVPLASDRRQWLHAAWRARCRVPLATAFAAGQRSVHGAVAAAGLRVREVALPPDAVADADTPAELPPPGDRPRRPGGEGTRECDGTGGVTG
jgi:molybdopterin-guanine dinucleotide biosynthesis protein A